MHLSSLLLTVGASSLALAASPYPNATTTEKPNTITQTITSTHIGTITTCPPDVHDCPIGKKWTKVVTHTKEYCPEKEKEKEEKHKHKKIVCHGDWCAPEEHCDKCEHHRVVCEDDHCRAEPCKKEDDPHKLVVCNGKECHFRKCHGEECKRKIVCHDGKCVFPKCHGHECEKKWACDGDDKCKFEKCDGEDCGKKVICKDGKCKPEEPCDHECPVPHHNKPEPQPNPQPHPEPTHRPHHRPTGFTESPKHPYHTRPANTTVPVQAGSDKKTVALNLLGAAAGLAFML